MANSMPFNSINADRPYKAEDWAWYFGTFIGNGVFPKPETGLQVVANEGMKITVNEGKAFINGYAFKNPSNYEITLDTADGALARIDRVVVRWDLVNRDMYIDVLKGTVSASPKAADVTRNSEIYELALADVTVSKGVTSITQAYITDQRFNTALCGIVKGTVEEIDTSVITAQFEDFVKTYQEDQLAEFEAWVESIKDVLDENAAGHLQLQIDEHTEQSVLSENGAHGFRYFEGYVEAHIYDEESRTLKWVTVPGSGIDYDGEKSVKGVIDELVAKEWTLLSDGVSSCDISKLPNNAEIYVLFLLPESNWLDALQITLHKQIINTSGGDYWYYNVGSSINANYNTHVRIGVNSQWIQLNQAYVNGVDVLDKTGMYVYCR